MTRLRTFFRALRDYEEPDDHPMRREKDEMGWLLRAVLWLQSPLGAAAQGLTLIAIGVVLAVGWTIYLVNTSHNAALAKTACIRSSIVGPYTAADYERRGVLPPDVAKLNREAIPARGSCD